MSEGRVTGQRQLWIKPLSNEVVAERFEEVAGLLEAQHANPFRVRAYRAAAETLRELGRPVAEVVADAGEAGLMQLPGIGRSLARSVEQLMHAGTFPLLERLRGENAPERIFTTVADIGPVLARRIHDALDIETLADLQAAAWDGRLAAVPGMGRKRIQAVRDSLAGRLRRPAWDRQVSATRSRPAGDSGLDASAAGQRDRAAARAAEREGQLVEELLDVDRQYRRLAAQDRLPRIAPRRFNPDREAWLPVLHTERGERHYTALFSNSPRAHEFGMTRDWVVIYRDDEGDGGQWTVITATFGPHRGERIVRGPGASDSPES